MTKLVFTADIQIHEHALHSKILPNGRNSRLQNGLDCLDQAFKLAKGGTLVINGDLLHDRKHISHDVLHGLSEVFNRHKDTPVIISNGNHDQNLRDGTIFATSILRGYPNCDVIDKPKTIRVGGSTLYIHPFTTNLDEFRSWSHSLKFDKNSYNILVVHQAVEGSLLARGTKSKGGLNLKDLRHEEADLVLLGHYHRPQSLAENVLYIGSPYEIDEGEAGDEKRFISVSDAKGKWEMESVPVTGMPKHVRWGSAESFKKGGKESDFNTVECATKEEMESVSNLACKPVLKTEQTVSAEGVSVGDLSVEEAVALSLKQAGREDLLEKVKKRLGL